MAEFKARWAVREFEDGGPYQSEVLLNSDGEPLGYATQFQPDMPPYGGCLYGRTGAFSGSFDDCKTRVVEMMREGLAAEHEGPVQ